MDQAYARGLMQKPEPAQPSRARLGWLALLTFGFSCGGQDSDPQGQEPNLENARAAGALRNVTERYATELVSFEPGPGAGFGERGLPDIALGPPRALPGAAGSLDVVSLGEGGTIVLGFSSRTIEDGPGPDFVVFENPFAIQGDPSQTFAELARVSVSEDGETWHTFACEKEAATESTRRSCAGWRIVHAYAPEEAIPIDPELTGGDPFDLHELGVQRARFVRIEDLTTGKEAPTAGFDLDAVGIIHLGPGPL